MSWPGESWPGPGRKGPDACVVGWCGLYATHYWERPPADGVFIALCENHAIEHRARFGGGVSAMSERANDAPRGAPQERNTAHSEGSST